MAGFVKLYRNICDNWLWNVKPFSKGQAWIDLLLMANYKDEKFTYKGKIVNGERGKIYRSITFFADRWGWGRDRARTFFNQLQNDGMIEFNSTTHQTTINIVNYSIYQDSLATDTTTDTQPDQQPINNKPAADPQQTRSRPDTYKNIKNIKNEKNNIYAQKICACTFFDDLWKLYPKKKGKSAVSKKALREIDAIGFEDMAKAIERYKAEIAANGTAEQYIMHGSTFFNGRYQDYLDVSTGESQAQTGGDDRWE